MRRFKSLHLAMLTLGSLCLNSAYASDTLHSLSDSEMSATTGQALMSMSYISPQDDANLEANRTNQRDPNNGGIGFYNRNYKVITVFECRKCTVNWKAAYRIWPYVTWNGCLYAEWWN